MSSIFSTLLIIVGIYDLVYCFVSMQTVSNPPSIYPLPQLMEETLSVGVARMFYCSFLFLFFSVNFYDKYSTSCTMYNNYYCYFRGKTLA